MKKILCIILALFNVFFTGCNSIILSGDLDFKPFKPNINEDFINAKEEKNKLKNEIDNAVKRYLSETEIEKYQVDGKKAFYILSDHDNRPEKIIDFKVLDYTSNGDFIYSYITPYVGDLSKQQDIEKIINVKPNKAPEKFIPTISNKEPLYNVIVLMSYNPTTRDYKVFYIGIDKVKPSDNIKNNDSKLAEMSVSADFREESIMANSLLKREEYFIFHNNIARVFDKLGNEILTIDYSAPISQEIERIKSKNSFDPEKTNVEVTINNVEMDGSYYIYIPISLEFSAKDQEKKDESLEELDKKYNDSTVNIENNTIKTSLICCYNMSVGGLNPTSPLKFVSNNTVYDEQIKYWSEIHDDGNSYDIYPNGVFANREELDRYLSAYSMKNIKNGVCDIDLKDDFTSFKDEKTEMVLYANTDVVNNSPLIHKVKLDGEILGANISINDINYPFSDKRKSLALYMPSTYDCLMNNLYIYSYIYSFNIGGIILKENCKSGNIWNVLSTFLQPYKKVIIPNKQSNYNDIYVRDNFVNTTKSIVRFFNSLKADLPYRYYTGEKNILKTVKPGEAISDTQNEFPLSPDKYNMEAVFIKKISSYSNSESAERMIPVIYPLCNYGNPKEMFNRYSTNPKDTDGLYRMNIEKSKTVTRTFSYYVETIESNTKDIENDGIVGSIEDAENEGTSGNKEETNKDHIVLKEETYTEQITVPISYRMFFPTGSYISMIETGLDDCMVSASGDMGAIYFDNNREDNNNPQSYIKYNGGTREYIIYDENIPGRALDASILYEFSHGKNEIAFLTTDQGIKFYIKENKSFPNNRAIYIPYENLLKPIENYQLVYDDDKDRKKKDDFASKLEISSDTQDIIDKKSKKDSGGEFYSRANLTMYSDSKIIFSSLSEGLFLLNILTQTPITLKLGAYYSCFCMNEKGKYMLVGFDTDKYSYNITDLAYAKCYEVDLSSQINELEEKAMLEYIDSLLVSYNILSHSLKWVEDTNNGTSRYEKMELTKKESEKYIVAMDLFFSDDYVDALDNLMKKFGFEKNQKALDRILEIRQQVIRTRQAFNEIYRITDLGTDIENPPRNLWILKKEGELLKASSTELLEMMMVELTLSDYAINKKETKAKNGLISQEEYYKYNDYSKQYKIAKALIEMRIENEKEIKLNMYESGLIYSFSDDLLDSENVKNAISAMYNSESYQMVLLDLKNNLRNSGANISWDQYLKMLLYSINSNLYERDVIRYIDNFYETMKLDKKKLNENKLLNFIYTNSILEIEEAIIDQNILLDKYENGLYRRDYTVYKSTKFVSKEEKYDAFINGTFYKVIKDIEEKNITKLEGLTVEKYIRKFVNNMQNINSISK